MAERALVERVGAEIIARVSQEFPAVEIVLDFATPRDDHEDAYLLITPNTEDREDINDIWAYAIKLVQDAYAEHDVYLVARMPGAGVILRERGEDFE